MSLKLAIGVGCAVWALGRWSRYSLSQEYTPTKNGSVPSLDAAASSAINDTNQPAAPLPSTPAARDIGNQILYRTLLESVRGAPMLCDVRQTIQFADKKRSSFGKYVRGGFWSLRMRMTLQIPAGDQMNSLLQISDGQLLTTLVVIGQQTSMTQVDLEKVRDKLTITNETLQDPVVAMYLAFGGQAEVLRTLCQKYDWTKVTEGQLGDRKVWWVRGVASEQRLGPHAEAIVDQRLFEKAYAAEIPPNVKLAIGHTDSTFPFWLYQVETWNDGDSAGRGKSYVLTEWDSPAKLTPQQLTPELFQLGKEHGAGDIREETKAYLPPSMNKAANLQAAPVRSKLR